MDMEFILIFVVCYYKNLPLSIYPCGAGRIRASQWAKLIFPAKSIGRALVSSWLQAENRASGSATSASDPTAGELALNPGALSLFSTEPAELALAQTLRPPAARREPRGQAEWPGFPLSLPL